MAAVASRNTKLDALCSPTPKSVVFLGSNCRIQGLHFPALLAGG
jgi:hypothetical protein